MSATEYADLCNETAEAMERMHEQLAQVTAERDAFARLVVELASLVEPTIDRFPQYEAIARAVLSDSWRDLVKRAREVADE